MSINSFSFEFISTAFYFVYVNDFYSMFVGDLFVVKVEQLENKFIVSIKLSNNKSKAQNCFTLVILYQINANYNSQELYTFFHQKEIYFNQIIAIKSILYSADAFKSKHILNITMKSKKSLRINHNIQRRGRTKLFILSFYQEHKKV